MLELNTHLEQDMCGVSKIYLNIRVGAIWWLYLEGLFQGHSWDVSVPLTPGAEIFGKISGSPSVLYKVGIFSML